MRRLRFLLCVGLALSFMVSAALADDIFISNQPFEGRVYGVGSEIRFSILDLAKALDIKAVQDDDGWRFGGGPVKTSTLNGVDWINLEDLPSKTVRVVRNPDFGTVDLYRVAATSETAEGDPAAWGGEGTLVYFGASWCPVTKLMNPTVGQVERSRRVHVAYVDVEDLGSPANKQYARLFSGDKVPYFVILDKTGKMVHSFVGFKSYPEFLELLEEKLHSKTP